MKKERRIGFLAAVMVMSAALFSACGTIDLPCLLGDCPNADKCDNGVLDSGETCDTAIQAGQNGACPTSCTAPDACTVATLTGTFCTAKCVYTPIVPCPTCESPLVYHPGLGMCVSLEGVPLGADCSSKACPQGQLCTSFYGIAGEAGGLFHMCVVPCGPEPDKLCPEGHTCGSISDGPTILICL